MIRLASALAIVATPVAAEAKQTSCLQKEEAMAIFQAMLPPAIEGMASKCSNVLPADAFLRMGAGAFVERIRRESTFDGEVLMRAFAKASGEELAPGISDKTLLMVTNDVAKAILIQEMQEKDCQAANDMIEAVSPLPTSNIMKLIDGMVSLIPDSGATKDFRICTVRSDG